MGLARTPLEVSLGSKVSHSPVSLCLLWFSRDGVEYTEPGFHFSPSSLILVIVEGQVKLMKKLKALSSGP